MIQKNSMAIEKLPMIKMNSSTISNCKTIMQHKFQSRYHQISNQRSNKITSLLREIRSSIISKVQDQQTLIKKKRKIEQKKRKKEDFLTKKQKKMYYNEATAIKQNQNINQNLLKFTRTFQTIQVQQIQSLQKPPHRQKTSICCQNEKLYLYGGIGCQLNIRLAMLDLVQKKWTFLKQQSFVQYRPTLPISGHSFTCYKGKGFIYGGTSTDTTHQLSIVNFNNFKFTQGQKCIYRRKNHAVVMISRYMVVHGGVQSNQVTNNLYFYDTQNNVWGYFNKVIGEIPYLSHHSMTSTFPSKTKKKISLLGQIMDPIFIFGGKNKQGDVSGLLYKIQFQMENVRVTLVNCLTNPQKRFSTCFHYVGNNNILLYGGKIQQSQKQNQNIVSDQVYTFNTEKLEWNRQNSSEPLPCRHGMASVSNCGKIYLFGGFIQNKYSDANVTVLSSWSPELLKTKSNFFTKTFSSALKSL